MSKGYSANSVEVDRVGKIMSGSMNASGMKVTHGIPSGIMGETPKNVSGGMGSKMSKKSGKKGSK